MARQNHQDFAADGLATVSEVAHYLSSSRSYVYKLMETGKLPYVKMTPENGKSARRIKRADVLDLIERNTFRQTKPR